MEINSASPVLAAFARTNLSALATVAASISTEPIEEATQVQQSGQPSDNVVVPGLKPKQALQHVMSIQDCKKVILWMIEDVEQNGSIRMCTGVIAKFLQFFRGGSNANLKKAKDWWKNSKVLQK